METVSLNTPLNTPSQMNAAVYHNFGKVENVLHVESVPFPIIKKPNEIIVKVHCAALNPVDYKIMEAGITVASFVLPIIPGRDFSGTVIAVGAAVTKFQVGDHVFGLTSTGAVAEYLVVSDDFVLKKPHDITFEEAASFPLVSATAYQALVEKGHIAPAQKVFINGGSGGVGIYAIQLAKHMGCVVTTSCSAESFQFVKTYGADNVIDYNQEDWGDKFAGHNFDVVFDCVGKGWEKAVKILKPNGIFVDIVGDLPHHEDIGITDLASFAGSTISRKFMSVVSNAPKYEFFLLSPTAPLWLAVDDLIGKGAIRPIVFKSYALPDIVLAYTELKQGHAKGKIIVVIHE